MPDLRSEISSSTSKMNYRMANQMKTDRELNIGHRQAYFPYEYVHVLFELTYQVWGPLSLISSERMSVCSNCQSPLKLRIEVGNEAEYNETVSVPSGSCSQKPNVPGDVKLDCGFHFHWYVSSITIMTSKKQVLKKANNIFWTFTRSRNVLIISEIYHPPKTMVRNR